MRKEKFTIALVGNPNAGKSSIFNQLTGLRQKVANFPGVTVDKKIGKLQLPDNQEVELVDFPGTYSLYPTTSDEKVVTRILTNLHDESYPDAILYVADITNLEKHLLLLSQIKDLQIPTLLILNMIDLANKQGVEYSYPILSDFFQVKVVAVSGKFGINMDALKSEITDLVLQKNSNSRPQYYPTLSEQTVIQRVTEIIPVSSSYQALVIAHHFDWLPFINVEQKNAIAKINQEENFHDLRYQIDETMHRYDIFLPALKKATIHETIENSDLTDRIDAVLTHRFWGPLIYIFTIFLVFQSIFTLAEYPKGWIESGVTFLSEGIKTMMPASWYQSLLTDGLLAGIGGIIVFIPQIAILFFLLALLEESGYMARVVYMFDNLMQKFGLNGRSMIALISGGACAIPAIMSTRTIENWKERMITIMVTPLISCSARLPVYAVLVGFVVPNEQKWLGFDVRGWIFTGLYMLGITAALLMALLLKFVLKSKEKSSLILELPQYRLPLLKNSLLNVFEKVKTFVSSAGQIILMISIVLWFLSYFGPTGAKENARNEALLFAQNHHFDEKQTHDYIASQEIGASYAGFLGKAIEPAIRPLGFDWKIGIALITSFWAREVFVGTMATIYSIGSQADDTSTIAEKMAKEKRADGTPVYTTATALSLLVFYVFAMQCMSTLAVVKRETKSWSWAIAQFLMMGLLAYLSSWFVYSIF